MPVALISPIEAPVPNLYMCNDLLDRFGLKIGSNITLRAGTAATEVKVVTSTDNNYISEAALKKLSLPVNDLLVRKQSDETIQIGPLIGLLISREKKRRLPPYSSQNKLLIKFLSYCKANKYLGFVFFPDDVDIEKNLVKGLYLHTNTDGSVSWRSHVFPVPDVVYDRILHRTLEKQPIARLVRSFFKLKPSVAYFNPKFLDKWETHSILSSEPLLLEHLPSTFNFDDPSKVSTLLKKYQTVYVKPIHGSLGQGIFKISRTPSGYSVQHRKGAKTFTRIFDTLEELLTTLETLKRNRAYVVQQGLEMLKYQNRVFDIRVLMQKDRHGKWTFTAMVVRVACEGSIFPNIAAGGEAVNIEKVWKELFSTNWASSETCLQTKKICIAAAHTLEKALGTFCEVGLDIGIDDKGRVWIIEINSKPSRKVFSSDQMALKTKSLRMPMDYAAYLSGFIPKMGDE